MSETMFESIGFFKCINPKCKFGRTFPFYFKQEVRKCPSCKSNMIKEFKDNEIKENK